MSLTKATITCYCKQISVPFSNISNHMSFPIPTKLCHCNTCSYISGSLGSAIIELKGAPDSAALAKCTGYVTSPNITWYFCSSCGSHLFISVLRPAEPDRWVAWPGNIDREDDGKEDTIHVNVHAFVKDTIDGGLLGRMIEVEKQLGTTPERMGEMFSCVYAEAPKGPTMSFDEMNKLFTTARNKTVTSSHQSDQLLAKCLCGSVQFYIIRPDQLKQYSEEVQFYLKANNTKYIARICTCRSCTHALGHPFQPWTYVMPENIVTLDGGAIEFGGGENSLSQFPGLKKIKAEDGVIIRSFCGTCGATVFYECTERPCVIDISTGILRSERGSLADDWLEWEFAEVSWSDECRNKELLEGITGRRDERDS